MAQGLRVNDDLKGLLAFTDHRVKHLEVGGFERCDQNSEWLGSGNSAKLTFN